MPLSKRKVTKKILAKEVCMDTSFASIKWIDVSIYFIKANRYNK